MNKFNLTSNKRILFFSFLFYGIFLVNLLVIITLLVTNGNLSKTIEQYYPIVFMLIAVLVLLIIFSPKHTSFYSSGEVIIIKSENIIWRKFTSSYNREITIKKKLIVESYESAGLLNLKKYLDIVTSYKNRKIKYKIDISLINKQNLNTLKSLLNS